MHYTEILCDQKKNTEYSIFDYDDETTAHDVVKAMNPMNESNNQTIHIFL